VTGDEPVDGLDDEFEFFKSSKIVAKVDGRHKARCKIPSPHIPAVEVVIEADRISGVFVRACCSSLDDCSMELE
jgi:hypothetical protein